MSALLMGVGWKVLAGFGALLAFALAALASLHKAKSDGVAQQQAVETKQREADLGQANHAAATVGSLDDDAVLAELHRDFDRKPVQLGERHLGSP